MSALPVWLRITRPAGIAGAHHDAGDVAQVAPLDAFDAIASSAAELLDPADLDRVTAARRAADRRVTPRRIRSGEPEWQPIVR